jgi:type II restriction enzyme
MARVISEAWAAANLFCAACTSNELRLAGPNTAAYDLTCPRCSEPYQLKSTRRWNDHRVVDSAYAAMVKAIRTDSTPNLLLMHRSDEWCIERILLIPRFFFTESIVERRKPLASTARRAGWVGCNILIGGIAKDGRIEVVENGECRSPKEVRSGFEKYKRLKNFRLRCAVGHSMSCVLFEDCRRRLS